MERDLRDAVAVLPLRLLLPLLLLSHIWSEVLALWTLISWQGSRESRAWAGLASPPALSIHDDRPMILFLTHSLTLLPCTLIE